ncbi:hypothetical protein D3C75_905360 [compost metagenome]
MLRGKDRLYGCRFRLRAEQQPRRTERVTADIVQGAPAPSRFEADVRGISGIIICKSPPDGPQIADLAAGDNLLHFGNPRVMPVHIGFGQVHARLTAGFHHLCRLPAVQGNRLFAQHMLAGFCRPDYPFPVQMVRKRNIYRINVGIGQQFLIAAVGLLHAEFLGYGAALFQPPARHRLNDSRLRFLDGRHDRACRDLRTAHDSPTQLLCHWSTPSLVIDFLVVSM